MSPLGCLVIVLFLAAAVPQAVRLYRADRANKAAGGPAQGLLSLVLIQTGGPTLALIYLAFRI